MSYKSTLNALLFILICTPAFCTAKLFPGYYINLNGDSVFCNFKFNDWNINPKTVTVSFENKEQTFHPGEISSFGVFGYGEYKSGTVSYHLGSIGGLYTTEDYSDSIETKSCFLKVIVSGNYSLYELITAVRPYYFIGKSDNSTSELIYRVKEKNMKVEEDQRYRNTIFDLYSKENISYQYMSQINTCKYNSKEIGTLIKTLNTKLTGKTYKAAKKQNTLEIDLYAGIINTSFPSAFDGLYIGNNKLGSTVSGAGGVNFLYYIPSHFNSFAIGASFGFTGYSSSSVVSGSIPDSSSVNYHSRTNVNEEFLVKNSLMLVNLYGMYTLNPLSTVNVYVKAGLNGNISFGSDHFILSKFNTETTSVRNGNPPVTTTNSGTESVVFTKGMYFNINAGLGLNAGRHKLECDYYSPAEIFDSKSYKIGMIGVYYYFTVLK